MSCEQLGPKPVVDAVDVLDVRARDHEHVSRFSWLAELVEERDHGAGAVDDVRCAASPHDLAEHTGLHGPARIWGPSCSGSRERALVDAVLAQDLEVPDRDLKMAAAKEPARVSSGGVVTLGLCHSPWDLREILLGQTNCGPTRRNTAFEGITGHLPGRALPFYPLAMARGLKRIWAHNGAVRIEAREWSAEPAATAVGVPLVFIPGGIGNASCAEVHGEAGIDGRIGSRWRAVLGVSRRGTGSSDAPRSGYTPADFAGDVAAAISAAGYERCAVFGQSMGVPIALEFALGRPPGLAALILGDAPPRYIDFKAEGTFTSLLQDPFEFPSWDAARASVRPTSDPAADERRWQLIRRTRLAENADGRIRLLMDRAALLRTVEESVAAHVDYAPRLDEIDCPVLLLVATVGRSPLAPEDVEIYRRSVRDLTVVPLAADHSLGQYTDPAALHAAIGALLDRVDAAVPATTATA